MLNLSAFSSRDKTGRNLNLSAFGIISGTQESVKVQPLPTVTLEKEKTPIVTTLIKETVKGLPQATLDVAKQDTKLITDSLKKVFPGIFKRAGAIKESIQQGTVEPIKQNFVKQLDNADIINKLGSKDPEIVRQGAEQVISLAWGFMGSAPKDVSSKLGEESKRAFLKQEAMRRAKELQGRTLGGQVERGVVPITPNVQPGITQIPALKVGQAVGQIIPKIIPKVIPEGLPEFPKLPKAEELQPLAQEARKLGKITKQNWENLNPVSKQLYLIENNIDVSRSVGGGKIGATTEANAMMGVGGKYTPRSVIESPTFYDEFIAPLQKRENALVNIKPQGKVSGTVNEQDINAIKQFVDEGMTEKEAISLRAKLLSKSAGEKGLTLDTNKAKSQLTDIWNKAQEVKPKKELPPEIQQKQIKIEAKKEAIEYSPIGQLDKNTLKAIMNIKEGGVRELGDVKSPKVAQKIQDLMGESGISDALEFKNTVERFIEQKKELKLMENVLKEAMKEHRGQEIIGRLSERAQKHQDKMIDFQNKYPKLANLITGVSKEVEVGMKKGYKVGVEETLSKQGERRIVYRAAREALNLTEAELTQIRKGKDIMAMTKQEFDDFLGMAEVRAAQIAEKSEAIIQLKGTIYEKELKKWENVQKAMKLPKISEMTIAEIRQLDNILSQYKTGDEFLPVRQLETIDNTVLKGIRTTREALEHLAKKYNLTPEQLPGIKPHPWMYDTQLARQHPVYDLLIDRYNESYLKAMGRIIELERKSDELIKVARKSSPKGISEKIAPVDKKIVNWLERDEIARTTLEKGMTAEELAAAKYQDSIYREYYDWLSKREIEKKFVSRFEDKYFPHTRRGFLEAWKEDGFLKAFEESTSQFKQEERMLTILDEKTGNILPYQKWVGFAQFRTGGLVPTQNAARAFKTYVTALEKARQFDEFIPEVMVYVHSLTPKGMTPRGIELNDSLNRFVKQWINAKKGRVDKQIIKPGSKMDWALRMGVTITRLRDLGLNIPVGIANIFGEQATNLTMLGAKNYSLGVARLATPKGIAITKKYPEFIGKTFWEALTEASNTAGDQLLGGMYGLFGVASRKGNQVFLLGSMTPSEFAKGTISIERLAQLRKGMGKYRVVEGAESVFGKSVEGAIGGQYKKWSIPILVSTASNGRKLIKILKETKSVRAVLSSKEGAESFYSVIIGAALGIGTYGYYNELEKKKDRNFVENIIFKSMRDAMSLIGALNPKFIGSFAAPRLASFIVDITEAIDNIIFLEKYKTTGELKGVKQLKRLLTPIAITSVIGGKEKTGLPQFPKRPPLPSFPKLPKP